MWKVLNQSRILPSRASRSAAPAALALSLLTALGACAHPQATHTATPGSDQVFWGYSEVAVPQSAEPTFWGWSETATPEPPGPTFWGYSELAGEQKTGPIYAGFSTAPRERFAQPARPARSPVATQR